MKASDENKVKYFHKTGELTFLGACADVPLPWGKTSGINVDPGIPATRRQASKWLMKKGIAYKTFKHLI